MNLSLAPYRTNWGVVFSRLRHDPPGSYSPVRDALVCSYYVRCVSTQRFLRDVSVNHVERAVKLLITRRTSQSSKLLRGTVRRLSLSPAAATGLRSSPLQKDDSTCASRTLLSSCLRGNAGSRCGNPGRPAEPTWPPGLFVDRSYVPCAGQRYCAGH